MRTPTLGEWLATCGTRLVDHTGMDVAPSAFRLGVEARLLDPRLLDPRLRAKAGVDDGHSLARTDLDDVESEIELAGAALEDLGTIERSGRATRKTRAVFADMAATLERAGPKAIGLSPIAFVDRAAASRAAARHKAIARRLGLADLRHATVGADKAEAGGFAVRIRGGRPAWAMLRSLVDDLAGDARDFAASAGEAADRLTLSKAGFRTGGPTCAFAIAPGEPVVFVDRARRSRGARAIGHALALFDPECGLATPLAQRSDSATLEASLRGADLARGRRIADFLEAAEADADLVALWRDGGRGRNA